MKKTFLLSLIQLILLSSCNFFRQNVPNNIPTKEQIENIIAGKDTSESSLLILRDKKIPPSGKANRVEIDSISQKGNKYYSILAEYPNPLYNRFAIIDANSDILLLDKSLSGRLEESILNINENQFIKIEEYFITKDTLRLKRISFYTVDKEGEAILTFRTYSELKEPGVTYTQEIIKLTPTEIITKIGSTDEKFSAMMDSSDKFLFDSSTKKYISVDSKFDSFVINYITNDSSQSFNPSDAITDTLMQESDGTNTNNNSHNFSLPLSKQWDEIRNVKVTYLMKKMVIGTKYINNQYGAEITVIQLPDNDSSENYIKYNLENISSGNYKVRYSEKLADGIHYYQFFEYSCSREKFLLILQTLKSTYDSYRSEYQNLINSFSMGC